MNSQDFVAAIQRYVMDAAKEDVIANLKAPPGRRVPPEARALSEWYNGLSEADTGRINSIISIAVHAATFGFLTVLDGVRTIDTEKGRFELFHVTEDRVLLNPVSIDLHDLLDSPY